MPRGRVISVFTRHANTTWGRKWIVGRIYCSQSIRGNSSTLIQRSWILYSLTTFLTHAEGWSPVDKKHTQKTGLYRDENRKPCICLIKLLNVLHKSYETKLSLLYVPPEQWINTYSSHSTKALYKYYKTMNHILVHNFILCNLIILNTQVKLEEKITNILWHYKQSIYTLKIIILLRPILTSNSLIKLRLDLNFLIFVLFLFGDQSSKRILFPQIAN